jgi:hypothetical protein
MKKIIIVIASLFFLLSVNAQETIKDTLYFRMDENYIASPTITPVPLKPKTFLEILKRDKKRAEHTNTAGYVFFIGNGYLYEGSKPKEILSLKNYIENRDFYFDGDYNKRVDNGKLKEKLLDKYVVLFVNENYFIQPRYLTYKTYHSEIDIQKKFEAKDTLYFNFSDSYLKSNEGTPNLYSLNEKIDEGDFFFEKLGNKNLLEPKKILCLKEYLHSSRYYDNHKKMISNFDLSQYFQNYIIYFVIKENDGSIEYIEVRANSAIE